jgi:hypothetical protein
VPEGSAVDGRALVVSSSIRNGRHTNSVQGLLEGISEDIAQEEKGAIAYRGAEGAG